MSVFSFVLDCLLASRACYAGPIHLDLVINTRSLLPHSSDRDPGSLHQTPTMHPNAAMLAKVLLGNLMLSVIRAQNGKQADVSCFVNTEVKSDPDQCEDSRGKCS